jgi:ADP-ribose pyrophosphatase YjhB (NUDIX family)
VTAFGRVALDGEEVPGPRQRRRLEAGVASAARRAVRPAARANAFCVTADGEVVLISSDAARWGWPGGRPEPGESWQQTLEREILEEACARVTDARLLGFVRGRCADGREKGLVLVRSIWRADVTLLPWRPEHEIPFRRTVPASELARYLWTEPGAEPIYVRAAHEAGLTLPN